MDTPLFKALPETEKNYLEILDQTYHFSFQEQRLLIEIAADLLQWQKGPLSKWIDEKRATKAQGSRRAKILMKDLQDKIGKERQQPTNYEDFFPETRLPDKYQSILVSTDKLMGRCPCPVEGEKTRCCNLKTLDAVQQCAFGCSYCSIQSFYNSHQIQVVGNLKERMETIELDADTWHIGTGQSSDSLLWGNDFGTLDALCILANRYPDTILELKTKSHRSDWIERQALPKNIVATWSLNAPTIIEKEEHLTASLTNRIQTARKAADKKIPIGFHLHPMVYFEGWQDEYRQVVDLVVNSFAPEELVMFSLGTLTFTKAVLKQLREQHRQSRILDMELTSAAGKYSYPLATKQEMFSFVYSLFPETWKKGSPFFYLCMEDPLLWEPTFKYSYANDRIFEKAMKTAYQGSINRFRKAGNASCPA
ncbi:spore photoproduct lyase family protein [uncultured Sphaerochaeta sp.]|uniref:SPL family radical SAM protein n=1 Tax=uncultured Sphaerochaeta sp. TaxID=886478 RepID=UPI002A0A2F03|nr:DNA photolyase [uncultured Sphaerochaeta sp.]